MHTVIPAGMQGVLGVRYPDFIGHYDPDVRNSRAKSFRRSLAAKDRALHLEEARLVALIPEREWERLTELAVKLRDEMEASGKYRLAEIMQVQAAVCVIADPQTRHELRSQAIDRVFRMFERENPPDAAAETPEPDEPALKDATTLDLMKKLKEQKAGGGAS